MLWTIDLYLEKTHQQTKKPHVYALAYFLSTQIKIKNLGEITYICLIKIVPIRYFKIDSDK